MTLVAASTGRITRRDRFELLRSQLNKEFQSFKPQYRDLADYILPNRPKFFVSDHNKGDRRNLKINDTTATFSTRVLSAGMMGGVTSPARPWFRLATPDPELNEFTPVKEWLYIVQQRMSWVFLRSNLYNSLPIVYTDLPTFGTAAMFVEEDFENVIHTTVFPIGSYRIAADRKGRVNTCLREFPMTVQQLIDDFAVKRNGRIDWSNFSNHVRQLYENGSRQTWIDVVHIVTINDEYDPRRPEAKHKRFLSYYYERGFSGSASTGYIGDAERDKYLRESGTDYFPVLCPRWGLSGGDVYATSCPGMDSIGDIKQLQKRENRIAEGEDKVNRPPTTGPSHLLSRGASLIPGGFTADDSRGGEGIKPVYQINPQLQYMEQKQEQKRQAIRTAYFEPLFLMLNSIPVSRDMTAREVQERHEEKLIVLGPVLERLNQDLLDPLIDITFDLMLQARMIPEPPEELQGMPLKIEYTSIMAQAQKLAGVSSIERYFTFVGGLMQLYPGVAAKVDFDQGVDEYAAAIGVPPQLVRSDEDAAAIREAQAEAARAQAEAEAMAQGSQTVKNLAQSPTSGETALAEVLNSVRGGALTAGGIPQ